MGENLGTLWRHHSEAHAVTASFCDNLALHSEASWSPSPDPDNMRVFHDGGVDAVDVARQPSSLALTIKSIGISFASLAIEIPAEFRKKLCSRHVLRLSGKLTMSRPLGIYCRLNLRHGPDTDVVTQRVFEEGARCTADFDLSPTGIGTRPLQHIWLDLIFEEPSGACISLCDIEISLHPRAEC